MLFSNEIVLHVAFFIEEWDTLLDYIEALRPANVLGPLEHLKQLQSSLQWKSADLWPKLDLRRMNDASRTALEAIVQHHPQVIVYYKMDLAWICRFVDPSTRIYLTTGIKYSREYFDMHELSRWKPFRVPSVDRENIHPNKIEETLSFLDNLESFEWLHCTRPNARCIFEFAAQSSSLVRLYLATEGRKDPGHCKITSSMALALVEWIDSKPIRSLEMINFTWENRYLRQGVVTAALSKSTLETFRLYEASTLNSRFCGDYKRGRKSIYFYLDVDSFDSDLAIDFLELFWPLKQPEKIDTMIVEGGNSKTFDSLWGILEPFLSLAKVKHVDFGASTLAESLVLRVAQDLSDLHSLQTLAFNGRPLTFEGAKDVLMAAPKSLTKLILASTRRSLTDLYTPIKCDELLQIAQERGIQLYNS